jgi:hypothetical protein
MLKHHAMKAGELNLRTVYLGPEAADLAVDEVSENTNFPLTHLHLEW